MSKITLDRGEPKQEWGRTGSGSHNQDQRDQHTADTRRKRTRDGRPIYNRCNRPGIYSVITTPEHAKGKRNYYTRIREREEKKKAGISPNVPKKHEPDADTSHPKNYVSWEKEETSSPLPLLCPQPIAVILF